MDSMDKKLCDICQHDIPIDNNKPDGLIRHLCVWDLFKKAPDYLGTKIDWVQCRICCENFQIPDGDID